MLGRTSHALGLCLHRGAGYSKDTELEGRWQELWSHMHAAHRFMLFGAQEECLPSCLARASHCR